MDFYSYIIKVVYILIYKNFYFYLFVYEYVFEMMNNYWYLIYVVCDQMQKGLILGFYRKFDEVDKIEFFLGCKWQLICCVWYKSIL